MSGVPELTSGSEVWVAIHNHRPEPLRLHTGQTVSTFEIITLADSPPAASPGIPLTCPAAAAKSPLPRVQRHHQPGRGRLGLHSAAPAHHRHRGTSTSPAISSPKPGRTQRRNGTGTADAVKRRYPPLQQSLGLTSCYGEEKGRQPPVLCGLQAAQRGHYQGRSPHSTHRRSPRRSTRCSLVHHPRLEERILAGALPGAGQGEDGLPHQQWPITVRPRYNAI